MPVGPLSVVFVFYNMFQIRYLLVFGIMEHVFIRLNRWCCFDDKYAGISWQRIVGESPTQKKVQPATLAPSNAR